MTAQSQNHFDAANFAQGLKQDSNFSDVNIVSVTLEKDMLNFSIKAQANLSSEEKNL